MSKASARVVTSQGEIRPESVECLAAQPRMGGDMLPQSKEAIVILIVA